MAENQKAFRFPRYIVYLGRLMTALRVTKKFGTIVCIYEDDELKVRTSFTENQFKYNEYYGYIERRSV